MSECDKGTQKQTHSFAHSFALLHYSPATTCRARCTDLNQEEASTRGLPELTLAVLPSSKTIVMNEVCHVMRAAFEVAGGEWLAV